MYSTSRRAIMRGKVGLAATLLSLVALPSFACSKQGSKKATSEHRTRPAASADPATKSESSAQPVGFESAADLPLPTPPGLFLKPDPSERREARALLVFLHGLGGSGRSSAQALGLERLAREHDVFVYAPDGEKDSAGRQFWNAHPACCNFDGRPVDDVARLGDTIDRLARHPQIDDKRLYVMGYSNGGFMALRLACALGDRLAAVVSIAGAGAPAESCEIAAPLHVLSIHGERDNIVRYGGGSVFDDPDRPKHESASETLEGWSNKLGCQDALERGAPLDLTDAAGAETRVEGHANCARGSVALWSVAGGSHSIVSSPNLIEHAWRFLEAHSKRQ